jgi:hypothetical protein
MYQKGFEIKTLLSAAAATTLATGTVVDLANSASVGKRAMKLMVCSNGNTYATATLTSFSIAVEECSTTNGTFTAVGGDAISTIGTAGAISEYHVQVNKRYVRGRISAVGTGGTSANIIVLLQNAKRSV